jgi:hypothetical protein
MTWGDYGFSAQVWCRARTGPWVHSGQRVRRVAVATKVAVHGCAVGPLVKVAVHGCAVGPLVKVAGLVSYPAVRLTGMSLRS